jgi:hypothetical protein
LKTSRTPCDKIPKLWRTKSWRTSISTNKLNLKDSHSNP